MKSEIDKTIGKYLGYYEEIFKDLKDEMGNMIVEYRDLNENTSGTIIPILVSVNGCKSSIDFDANTWDSDGSVLQQSPAV